MLAFLGMVVLVVVPVGPETRSKLVKLVNKHCTLAALMHEDNDAWLSRPPLLDGRVHCGHCGLVLGIVSSLPKKECYLS